MLLALGPGMAGELAAHVVRLPAGLLVAALAAGW